MRSRSTKRQAILLRPRINLGDSLEIGPGKIDLLRQIAAERSISAAARSMGMSYKRAWMLLDTLNRGFGEPVIATSAGGKNGGGTTLTPLGEALVVHFTALEKTLNQAAQPELAALRDRF